MIKASHNSATLESSFVQEKCPLGIQALFRCAILVTLFSLMSACSSGPKIVVNQDPAADFTQYQTYAYVQPLSTGRVTDKVRENLEEVSNAAVADMFVKFPLPPGAIPAP